MHLTRESEYALLGLTHLVQAPPGVPVSVGEVAAARRLPEEFLSKIFQKLARHGVVVSGRGRGSGFTLARPPAEVRLAEVIEAVEGPTIFQRCLLWRGYCADSHPCPLHFRLRDLHPGIRGLLNEVSLADYMEQSGHRAVRAGDVPPP